MPRLWTDTIEAHRREVHGAILDATVGLAAEHGLRAVTMSQIAEQVGIGRATLYKYFPDVEAILAAWHERQLTGHLTQLTEAAAQAGGPYQRLEAVLEAYASSARRIAASSQPTCTRQRMWPARNSSSVRLSAT
jgi:AcrR family transcriptional regulator